MFILNMPKFGQKLVTLILAVLGLSLLKNDVVSVFQQNIPIPLEQVNTEERVIALTVNVDWGEEYIPQMLEIFEDFGAEVTFFVTGRWAEKNPELLKMMASKGHSIQNHGYYHSHPDKQSIDKNKEELLKTEKVIENLIGKKTTLYAPPYGERGKNGLLAAGELGYTTVLWTLDTIDWRADSTPELIVQRVVEPKIRNGIKPDRKGAIVLMHPKENTIIALPQMLSRLQQEGFRMVTVERLITFNLSGNTTP
ncbi:MAG: polysaccharide deacetylase family protein [Peptococcaceae bacterium]|nr:polysaccharide deacetylase family protein [Peptococcaceae bacterium]